MSGFICGVVRVVCDTVPVCCDGCGRVCVYVCVCVREREREGGETEGGKGAVINTFLVFPFHLFQRSCH